MAAPRTSSRFSTSYRSTDARSAASAPASKVPIPLAKRLLFPQLPTGSELPSLLLTDDRELNTELYDFLALALRGFVNPWWTKISRYDKEFLPEITRIVAIFLRGVEARLAIADLPSLVFRDVPTIISRHYEDYRNAAAKVGTSYATGGASTLPHIFHQLQPHMAISSDGRWDEIYVRQAVEHVMKSCLPSADWEAEVERTIVREIVAKVILGNIFGKITQPWFIHKTILDFLGPPPDSQPKPPDPPPSCSYGRRFTFQSIVVFFLSAVQTVSGLCLAAIAVSQKILQTIRSINSATRPATDPHRANLARPFIDMMEEILTMRSRASSSSMLSLVVLCAGFSGPFLDRALPYVLYNYIISTPRITSIVIKAKKALFPNGYPAPTPPDPSPEEQILLREQLETRILLLLPSPLASLLLGPDGALRRKAIASAIDPLSSPECNLHLLIILFDAILLTLFPELEIATSGPVEYTEEDLEDDSVI